MFSKETIFIDTSKGPKIYTRYRFNPKPLIKVLVVLLLVASWLLTCCYLVFANEPQIEVHCTDTNTLVFRGIETGEYIAYVQLANKEQFEAIKNLKLKIDPSLDNFRLCKTEVHHYEIRLDGEMCYKHAIGEFIPAEYNYSLSDDEEYEMLTASSEEVQYLYKELCNIFKTEHI